MARELALMPNIPAVNYRGQFLDIQQILQEIQRGMLEIQQQLQQQHQQLQQQHQQLQQQHQQLQQQQQQLQQQQQQLVQIRQDISRSERNNFARLLNSSALRFDDRLEVLYGVNNEPVQDFPQTVAHAQAATGPQLDALLVQLDLPVDGHVDDRKRRFIKSIGLPSF